MMGYIQIGRQSVNDAVDAGQLLAAIEEVGGYLPDTDFDASVPLLATVLVEGVYRTVPVRALHIPVRDAPKGVPDAGRDQAAG